MLGLLFVLVYVLKELLDKNVLNVKKTYTVFFDFERNKKIDAIRVSKTINPIENYQWGAFPNLVEI